jgi:alcohol dehydrogenase
MACGDKRAAFRAAILDPELTLTQPARVAALTGIDALAHAIETYVTKRRSDISLSFSREAWRHLSAHFTRVIAEPSDIEARGAMQLGACLAGLAIENSMLGAAHALANPLTATYAIAHGQAIALMLPHVIRCNGRHVERLYAELLESSPAGILTITGGSAADALADFASNVSRQAGLAGKLSEVSVPRGGLPKLAAAAALQWTGKFNPVEMSVDDYQNLYEAAY